MDNKLNITAIVQARTTSSRFPRKVLQKINGKTIMQIIHSRLKKSNFIDKIVFAIPKNDKEKELKNHLKKNKFILFEGKDHDVLDRYYSTAKKFKSNIIVRITGDCPLIDYQLIDSMIKIFLNSKFDCVLNYSPPTFPDGLDAAIISKNCLYQAWKLSKTKFDREHVMPYIIRNSKFKKFNVTSKINFSAERWTIDEPVDLEVIRNVFKKFKSDINFPWKNVIKLRKKYPSIFLANKNIKRDEGAEISNGLKLWKRANNIIPGGSMLFSKKSELFLPGAWPSYFSKAKGSKIWDLDGKKYLDMCLMGVGTNILGYGNQEVDKKVLETVKKGNMSTLNCPEEVALAEKLIEMHSWADCAKFTRSGGEANSVAIRIARAATGKDKVAICGYHGWHDWYLAANLNKSDNLSKMLLPGLLPVGVPSKLKGMTFTFNYNDINSLEKIIKNNKDLCAIKMEVSRNTPPKKNFLKNVRELANKHKILLIFDECTSGFRQTFGGLHKHYGVNPDIAIFGKALGNGYAINAIIGRKEIMNYTNSTFISSTFWTERIGPSAALKTLEVMQKKKSWKVITKKGILMKKSLEKLAKKNNLKIKFYGLSALLSFEIISKNFFKYKNLITQELLKKSILATNSIYFCTEHNKEDMTNYLYHLEKVFNLISDCENNGRNIDSLLENPISQKGFSRLN
tara:strand:- start:412 stop:2457 length:2046 start_codon:yes stop_codon:yes gene_type:complete